MNIGIDFFRDLAVTETAMDVYGYIESGFDCIVRYCILALEMVGVFVLMGSVLRAIIAIFRKKENLRLQLAEGIALSLEFKIGGELLRTVIAREWKELWGSSSFSGRRSPFSFNGKFALNGGTTPSGRPRMKSWENWKKIPRRVVEKTPGRKSAPAFSERL